VLLSSFFKRYVLVGFTQEMWAQEFDFECVEEIMEQVYTLCV